MEGHHLQVIQQLQLEVAEARERSGVYADDLVRAASKTKEALPHSQNKGNQSSVNGGSPLSGNTTPTKMLRNFRLLFNWQWITQDQVPGVHIVPSSLFAIGACGLPGQVEVLHPLVMQHQGAPPFLTSANTHIPQSHVGQLQSVPAISFHPQWQNQQEACLGSNPVDNDSTVTKDPMSKGPINQSGYEAAVRNGEMKLCACLVAFETEKMICRLALQVQLDKKNLVNEWKLGQVELVKVCENHPQGVRFKDTKDAHKCIELMNVRW
ncbi:hypothetical protein C5167_033628 [Papaver somniferum]|uniref:Uncharacterized protein n=1 Tax=Papaver somniferum TaxID=3469 RepID=A0A4Y7KEZ6_PAPSO|nr:hypothetical protein C5167_033628 [Papaver somniferum]